jgi:hypothetical protein
MSARLKRETGYTANEWRRHLRALFDDARSRLGIHAYASLYAEMVEALDRLSGYETGACNRDICDQLRDLDHRLQQAS